ncbi:hypothetical protein DSO57_1028599 [Entomophthora muscae]|uniref:Uncharacterized protein n=1 Tax=Entomophthora muscae TaxID=34485 RepID=A0ACC2SER3_9FUNG|nr:hypothetical protein DSO57_1028599 [Entomophthora muscae]
MQAKYKLLTNPSPLLENDNSSKPVPGYNPGHTMGTGDQEPTATLKSGLRGHTCWSYPINYANMHLADVCLYNFDSALRRLKPATYKELCTQIDMGYELFPSASSGLI